MMNTRMEIKERCFSTSNILLEVKDILKGSKKVTREFYFLRIFWIFQIERDPENNTIVSMIVDNAPNNCPRFRFAVTSGWLKPNDCSLFEKSILQISTERLIREKDFKVIIWANNLSSYLTMFPESTSCFLCTIQLIDGLNNIPELYKELIPVVTPTSERSLTGNLKSLLDTSIMTDVILKCVNKCIPAHKCILSCRSPVFKAMIQDDSEESEQSVLEIEDVKPTVFQKFIDYIYTGNIDMRDEYVDGIWALLKAADKFRLPTLKERCLNFLKENIEPINACDLLLTSDLNGYPDLKAYVISFIANRKDFLASQDWQEFSRKHEAVALDVLTHYVTISELRP